ncbi:hydroquinone glucosyltransferase-like [Panicum virgatum]|uniref:hydroquinone glucosyltransferase-like n=1 Tax=Panicum virgatum TaxID=38727 RepID=UPI0019D5DA1E|nr:hydroquinone glucosyltransferase-like [Panicum virgatum]
MRERSARVSLPLVQMRDLSEHQVKLASPAHTGSPMESSASTVAVSPRPHVMLVASPGTGHLIPMTELARRLVAHHSLTATLVTFTDQSAPNAHSAVLSSLSATQVSAVALPAVALDDLLSDAHIGTSVPISIPHLRALLRDITSAAPLAVLVPDFFGSTLLPLAAELGVPAYIFSPSNLSVLALMRNAVELNDGAATGEYRDLPDVLRLPGGVLLRREDYTDNFKNSKEPIYAHVIEEGRRYRAADGFLVNSFHEMEPGSVEEFKQAVEQGTFPPVYPVGPLIRPCSDEDDASACLDWLDRQLTGSVVYVSFGSAGALSVEQTAELAAGLEGSGHRFLWVMRMPSLDGENSAMITAGHGIFATGTTHSNDKDDPLAWLPEGFLERTSGRGGVGAAGAVLSHPATAAFLSHCGWNSTLESVASGVPMVAWPLYAEQSTNAAPALLSENVALRLRATRADGLIAREEIAAAVREVMGGEEKGRTVRRRAGELQRACVPGGSSWQMLEEVAGKWKAAALGRQKR